jgi:hypothetical protein
MASGTTSTFFPLGTSTGVALYGAFTVRAEATLLETIQHGVDERPVVGIPRRQRQFVISHLLDRLVIRRAPRLHRASDGGADLPGHRCGRGLSIRPHRRTDVGDVRTPDASMPGLGSRAHHLENGEGPADIAEPWATHAADIANRTLEGGAAHGPAVADPA